jgi:hypothetical protein
MAKKKMPARGLPTPAGLTSDVLADDSIAQPKRERHHRVRSYPARLTVQPCPGKPEHWLVAVDNLAPFPIRRTKLVRWKRFRNVTLHQIGAEFPEEPPPDWDAMVVAAEAEGGATS